MQLFTLSCNKQPFFLQWNGKWRVVIVDQGWALGSRTAGTSKWGWHLVTCFGGPLPADHWRVSRGGNINECPLWSQPQLAALVASCLLHQDCSFHSSPRWGNHTVHSPAAKSAVVTQVKWEQALEEGLKGSDAPGIHFKHIIRACWNTGLIGLYEYGGSIAVGMAAIISRI